MNAIRLLLLCGLLACGPAALAARLELPLRVPLEPVGQALRARLASSPERPDEVFREGRCRYLTLGTPKLEAAGGALRLSGPGSAALGVELFGNCQNAIAWRGTVQFTLVPRIDRAGRLRLHVVDSALTDASGAKAAPLVWDLSKRYLHPRIERFAYDIGAARAALVGLVRNAAPPAQADAMARVLDSLQVLEPRIESKDVAVPIALDVPDAWLAAPPSPAVSSAPLTEAEVEALEKALEPWDAFLVYSIRQLALDNDDGRLRERLFTLLLESRYQLVALLSGAAPAGSDPVRALFVDTWNGLRALLDEARYATFIDAGDALVALDNAAPGLGARLTPQGLRQLARGLRPSETGDPLAYGWDVDPQLRELFSVEDVEPPAPSPPAPEPKKSLLDLFVTSAYASVPPLDRWLPASDELPLYEERVGALLRQMSSDELKKASVGSPQDAIYRNMVPTTALIESCWHQYVRRHGKVTYLRSAAGSVGIMQINQHVWRGFYDLQRLRWDTAYNVRAGAAILMRYLKAYAIPYAEKTGDPNHIPRALYAVYNAGPRAVGRFNKPARNPREARVDERLWSLYQAIAAGGEPNLASCSVKQTDP